MTGPVARPISDPRVFHMGDINTSGRTNPKPGTFINVGARESDYVFVGNYRIKVASNGWHLYIANGEGWCKPRKFGSRPLAVAAVLEHMMTGDVSAQPLTVAQRMTQIEQRLAALEDQLAVLEDQLAVLEEAS